MREIKFRARDVKGNWHIGNLSVLTKNIHGGAKAGTYISNSCGMPFAYEARPETVGQFIGLHDKNGKGIYEGDIDEARGICVWIEEDCRWAFQEVETGYQHGLFAIAGDFNIIGNIHENPELLNDL